MGLGFSMLVICIHAEKAGAHMHACLLRAASIQEQDPRLGLKPQSALNHRV